MRVLPNNLRNRLKEPFGPLVDEQGLLKLLTNQRFIVSVGDQVTYTLLKNDITPHICIVDFIIKRKDYPEEMKNAIKEIPGNHIKINNPAGTITDDLWDTLVKTYNHIEEKPVCIEVEGEEDLAALPAIFLAKGDVTVIYGLPDKGVVVVKVTEQIKQKIKDILDKM